MTRINEHFLKLPNNYLFTEIARRVSAFQKENPHAEIIRLGIGDVTQPLPRSCVEAMRKAVDEMGEPHSFRGYGPEQGYDFLIEKIIATNYLCRGIQITSDEVFVSDGSKSDIGNIQEIFSVQNKVAITDPVYPVYLDTNIMAGRTGAVSSGGIYQNVIYLPCRAENNFTPALPKEKADIIYLCCPNNPTGTTLSTNELKKWVDYAKENEAVILFDAAYASYITDTKTPRSIYEIKGAKDVAIEFRSFSKTAGFTGTRCGYTVVPKNVIGFTRARRPYPLNALWHRRHTTKFNGTSYIVQRGAEAVYSPEGQKEVQEIIAYYMTNAKIIREGLTDIGLQVYGGINAPYLWLKTPKEMDSWTFFDKLLHEVNIVGTPGVGFGPAGEGYLRLTAFGDRENSEEAIARLKNRFSFCDMA